MKKMNMNDVISMLNDAAESGDEAKVNSALKQASDFKKKQQAERSLVRGFGKTIASHIGNLIPSPKSIVAGITTNSPFLAAISNAYSRSRDVANDVGSNSQGKGKNTSPLDEAIRKLEKSIESKDDKGSKDDSKVFGELVKVNSKLDIVLNSMNAMQKEWTGQNNQMYEELVKQTKSEEESVRQRNQQMEIAKRDKLRSTEKTPVIPTPTGKGGVSRSSGDGGSLGGIGALLKKSGGLIAGLAGGVVGFLGGFIPFAATLKKAIPFIGKAAKALKLGPLAIITSLYEFGKGFFKADEILKRKTNLSGKLLAGSIQLVDSFTGIADDIIHFFGGKSNIRGAVHDAMIKWFDPLSKFLDGMIEDSTKFVKESWKKLKNWDYRQTIDNLITGVQSIFTKVKNTFKDMPELYKNGKAKAMQLYQDIKSEIDGKKDAIKTYISDLWTGIIDTMKEKLKSMTSILPDWVRKKLGWMDEPSTDNANKAISQDRPTNNKINMGYINPDRTVNYQEQYMKETANTKLYQPAEPQPIIAPTANVNTSTTNNMSINGERLNPFDMYTRQYDMINN